MNLLICIIIEFKISSSEGVVNKPLLIIIYLNAPSALYCHFYVSMQSCIIEINTSGYLSSVNHTLLILLCEQVMGPELIYSNQVKI